MTQLFNEILIEAPMEKIWEALSNLESLEKYDPTVKKCVATSSLKYGEGGRRKVEMKDGKNWFEEKCTLWKPNETLTYELTACSFPVHSLNHTYSFERVGNQVKVKQIMSYQIKFGLLGKILDLLVMRKQSDAGIKAFLLGLKSFSEDKK